MNSLFWGLRLEPGKRYSTVVDRTFHVSMAAMDCSTVKNDTDVLTVMLEEKESNVPFVLCNLQKNLALQCPLDLNFMTGDSVTFSCKGSGTVHLSGYVVPDDEDDFAGMEGEEDDGEEEEDEDIDAENIQDLRNGLMAIQKRKQQASSKQANKKMKTEEQPEEDSDDDDDSEDGVNESFATGEDSDDDSEEDDDEDDTSEPETPSPTKQGKQNKKNEPSSQPTTPKQTPGKQQKTPNGQGQSGKPRNDTPLPAKKGQEDGQKKVLQGGVMVKELKQGSGPPAKPGKTATVYYTGRLKSTNKVFDSTTQGSGFRFKVGKGEVIKGWDVGISGMKVGGKRLITCPPQMAYGAKGSPPTIPPNSTLVFEVELKSVN